MKLLNAEDQCAICGEVTEEGLDLCEKHLDEVMVLVSAIMEATSSDDVVAAWITWKNGQDGRKKTTFLDNCQNCGKLMWIEPWERKNGHYGGKYCSRECKAEASKNTKDKQSAVLNVDVLSTALSVSAPTKNPDAVALGHLGGLKGGKARANKLSHERRSEIASNAAKTRWGEKDKALGLTTNSKCPQCGARALEQDGTDLHCWACGHIIYYVFAEMEPV